MRVVALVEYEVLGDEEYSYIDSFNDEYPNEAEAMWCWRARFVRSLLARGIICNKIKIISVEYEK